MTHAMLRFGAMFLGATFLGALLLPAPAHAQMGGANGVSNGRLTGPVVGAAQNQTRKAAPPPALPGARTVDTDPAPMDRPAGDLRPTEALFDAVNRGDISSAREAIGRGADLNATNVLGLTPIELAVDLGRNDITFLLLSMRGASGGSPQQADPGRKGTTPQLTSARAEPTPRARRAIPVAATQPRPAALPAPRQFADIPGTPVPQVGFLGFGATTR